MDKDMDKNTEIEKFLQKIYYDFNYESAYTNSFNTLYKEAKKEYPDISKETVEQFLRKQPAYTHHVRPRFKFQRRKVLVLRVNRMACADLIDVSNVSQYNQNYTFLITLTDHFSKKIFCQPLKSKSPKDVLIGLKQIVQDNNGIPWRKVHVDDGSEWKGEILTWAQENFVTFFSTKSSTKAALAELSNRLVEEVIYRVMVSRNSFKYIDVLQDIVLHLNKKRSTRLYNLNRLEAHKKENEMFLRNKYLMERKRLKEKYKHHKNKFKLNDQVRYLKPRGQFFKGYEGYWSKSIHVITNVYKTYPPSYRISDQKKLFYESELLHVSSPVTPLEKGYYISGTKEVNKKKLRSGKFAKGETLYWLKSRNDPSISTYINLYELNKLKDNGFL